MVQNIQRYISQLGMMVIAVGLSSYNVALFHLVNHAFYKGLLFLGAGAVIHAVADNQDFRKYGGLIAFLPLSYTVMLIASLSLVAFPFMTGFYSKDLILESAYGQFHFSSVAVYFIATIGAMFTTLYSVKVLYLTFLTNANGPLTNYKKAHEGDVFMSLPLVILAVFSILFGYMTKDMFIGMASGFFSDNSLFTHPLHEIMLETEFVVPTIFKLLPFFLTVTLSVFSLILSEFLPKSLIYFKFTRTGYNIFSFFNQRFLIELFYNKYITRFVLSLGGQTTKVLDKGSIELLGPYGLEKGLLRLSKGLSSLDTGVLTSYALYILIGLILYILIPYISLKDISILFCMLFALLRISVNTLSIGIPNNIASYQPHPFASLPLQSGLFKIFTRLGVACLTFSLLTTIAIGIGFSLAYRIPTRFMLGQLDLLQYYALFNVIITLCSITAIAYVKGKNVSSRQLYIAIFFAFSVPLLIWYVDGDYKELYASLQYLFAHLPLVWNSIKDNRMIMGPQSLPLTLSKIGSEGASSGGGGVGSSSGTGGASSSGTGGASSSATGDAGSTNVLDPNALIERKSVLEKDLMDDSFILKGNMQQQVVQDIAKKFPVIDARDVPRSILVYLSFYNIKCRALQEHMIIESCDIKLDNSTTKPELALAWRKAKLASISEECSETMTRINDALPRSDRRCISKTFKKKPW